MPGRMCFGASKSWILKLLCVPLADGGRYTSLDATNTKFCYVITFIIVVQNFTYSLGWLDALNFGQSYRLGGECVGRKGLPLHLPQLLLFAPRFLVKHCSRIVPNFETVALTQPRCCRCRCEMLSVRTPTQPCRVRSSKRGNLRGKVALLKSRKVKQ